VFRVAVRADDQRAVTRVIAAFRPAAFERLSEEGFTSTLAAVDVGGVEKRDARLESRIDDGTRSLEIDPHSEVVAAHPDDGNLGSVCSQSPRAHDSRC